MPRSCPERLRRSHRSNEAETSAQPVAAGSVAGWRPGVPVGPEALTGTRHPWFARPSPSRELLSLTDLSIWVRMLYGGRLERANDGSFGVVQDAWIAPVPRSFDQPDRIGAATIR
jgi:hypothetical protein